MVGLAHLRLELAPAGLWRNPEDVLGYVLVPVLGCFLTPFVENLGASLLESVRDVLEEDEAEDDVLVLGGVHVVAEGVGHAPEVGAVVEGFAGGGASGGHLVNSGNGLLVRGTWCHGEEGGAGDPSLGAPSTEVGRTTW